MFPKLFPRRSARKASARRLHDAIRLRSRQPEPYQAGWVADTLDGRFSMLTLYAVLVIRVLRTGDEESQKVADALYEELFAGFDHALRETGVGDASIARKVRKLGESFVGFARALDDALRKDEAEDAVAGVIERNIETPETGAQALALIAISESKWLQTQSMDALNTGEISWNAS